jgi:NhaP-type Na+/H+ and K+/H+ antiporter
MALLFYTIGVLFTGLRLAHLLLKIRVSTIYEGLLLGAVVSSTDAADFIWRSKIWY